MNAVPPATQPTGSQQAVVEAALVLLERMALSPADLVAAPRDRKVVPTFAEYVPVVSAAVSAGTRRAYGSYWNRIVEHWGDRRLDEPTPSDIRQLMTWVKTNVVARRNARGGRSAQEHLVAALRCLYRRAAEDGLISDPQKEQHDVVRDRQQPLDQPQPAAQRLVQPRSHLHGVALVHGSSSPVTCDEGRPRSGSRQRVLRVRRCGVGTAIWSGVDAGRDGPAPGGGALVRSGLPACPRSGEVRARW